MSENENHGDSRNNNEQRARRQEARSDARPNRNTRDDARPRRLA